MGTPSGIDWGQVEVAASAGQIPGVQMAGFCHHGHASVDIAMIPHPSVTVLLDLTGNGIVYDLGGRARCGSVVVGLNPGPVRVRASGSGEVLQIRLSPVIAAAMLGVPDVLAGTVTPLANTCAGQSEGLAEQLLAVRSWEARFGLVSRFLSSRANPGLRAAPEVAYAWAETTRRRGSLRIDTLAADTGWSRQRLWSRFRAQIGLSPKAAAQLVRFDHAARLLSAGRCPADVAYRAGYADQSHLHRQIKVFAQATPGALALAPWLAIDDVAWPATRHHAEPYGY